MTMEQINWAVVETVGGPILAAIVAIMVDRWLERRPKLITWLGHTSAVRMPPAQGQAQPYDVYTHALVVRNAGRKSANNVRLGHQHLPNFSLYPGVAHRVENVGGGGAEIVLPTLVPSEQVTVSYMYFPPVTYQQVNSYVKSDEGLGRFITILPTPMPPIWLARVAWIVFLVGVSTVLYLLALLVLHGIQRVSL